MNRAGIERAKTADIVEVVEAGGLYVPGNKQICCPFHVDSRPSMKLYSGTSSAFCFACHKSFDVIDFAIRLRRLNFEEAVEFLLENFETEEVEIVESEASGLKPLSYMLDQVSPDRRLQFSEIYDLAMFGQSQGELTREEAVSKIEAEYYICKAQEV